MEPQLLYGGEYRILSVDDWGEEDGDGVTSVVMQTNLPWGLFSDLMALARAA